MRPTIRILPVLIAGALVLAACGSVPTGDGGTETIDHPTGAGDLVLRVSTEGGFVPVDYALSAVPGFSLMGDGTMIVTGPQIEIYPPPAMTPLVQRSIDEAGVQAILQRAEAAGLLGQDRSYTSMQVTDAPTTTFTVVAGGKAHVVSVYALGIGDDASGMSESERRDRRALGDLQNDLFDLQRWLPDGSIGPEVPFTPAAVRLFVGRYRGDAQVPQESVPWPLDEPLSEIAVTPVPGGFSCGVVEGANLEAVLPELDRATTLTPWVSDGRRSALIPRPMLPDERGC
ncbi:MAG: hypothetical protein WEA54_04720 [Actinomycetota bacterium]